ncbi:MAG: hypothetical protein DSY79_13215 [Chloroflexi bacterium]|nr:MAG: hypothetical protein DSY79_13215 [Chloroflexota bacterium]
MVRTYQVAFADGVDEVINTDGLYRGCAVLLKSRLGQHPITQALHCLSIVSIDQNHPISDIIGLVAKPFFFCFSAAGCLVPFQQGSANKTRLLGQVGQDSAEEPLAQFLSFTRSRG